MTLSPDNPAVPVTFYGGTGVVPAGLILTNDELNEIPGERPGGHLGQQHHHRHYLRDQRHNHRAGAGVALVLGPEPISPTLLGGRRHHPRDRPVRHHGIGTSALPIAVAVPVGATVYLQALNTTSGDIDVSSADPLRSRTLIPTSTTPPWRTTAAATSASRPPPPPACPL